MKIKALKSKAPAKNARSGGRGLGSTGKQVQAAIRQLKANQANHIVMSGVDEGDVKRLRQHIMRHSKILGCPVHTYMSGDDLIVIRR